MDTPSFATCKRLAAAGWNQDPNGPTREWWIEPKFSTKWLGDHSDVVNVVGDPEVKFYAAPKIGELLAEIQRRGWAVILNVWQESRAYIDDGAQPTPHALGIGRSMNHAEALALALCEALEAVTP